MRALMSAALICAAALATAACGGNETRNMTSATEIAPIENEAISDAMVTGITPAAPIGNMDEPAANIADNAL